MKMTITGQIDGKSVPITIPIEKVIESFWPYATKPSALSVSTELDADGISANFMLGQETKDSYPGIWLTSKKQQYRSCRFLVLFGAAERNQRHGKRLSVRWR